ncbi:transcription factor 19-like [Branchiostoma floridae x Branchiostoma japonicum]
MEATEGPVYRLRRVGKAASRPDVQDVFRLPSTPSTPTHLQIGRNPAEADVFIDSKVHPALISRRHAEIRVSPDGRGNVTYDITDRSVNGTYVNDIRLQPRTPHRLQEGDTVTFGHLKAGTVQPGQRSVQAGSEFKFKFEQCPRPAGDADTRTDSETPTTLSHVEKPTEPGEVGRGNGRQLFPSVPSPDVLHDISNWVQKSKLVHTGPAEKGGQKETGTAASSSTGLSQFSVDDEDNDSDSEIFSIAATLQIPSDSDSDSDIFCPTEKPLTSGDKSLPKVRSDSESPRAVPIATAVPMATNVARLSQSPIVNPRDISDSKDSSTVTSVSQTKRKRRPPAGKTVAAVKRRKPVKRKRSGDREDWGPCDSFDCSRPEGEMLSWVQCDQCEAWYHVACAGCDYDTVRQETAAFNCGCL